MRNYKTWFWVAVSLQFLTAGLHSLSFFHDPAPANETERTLIDLMQHYQQDLGGMQVTMADLMTALSACFSLLCLLGGLSNAYLLRRLHDDAVLGGILWINLIVFGILFAVMAVFAFPPPIILTGGIFGFLLLSLVVKTVRTPRS